VTAAAPEDYTRELPFAGPRERVFEALATTDGLAGWWTPLVAGDATEGGQLSFEFDGVEETIVMHVERAERPSAVRWRCLLHTGHPEWEGTRLVFELERRDAATGLLRFRHIGLSPQLSCFEACERGWEHFLQSLIGHAERAEGSPFEGRAPRMPRIANTARAPDNHRHRHAGKRP
jgi:uncharacterized protein YndB with AHSA1/START domain